MQFAPLHSRVCQLGKVLLQRRGLRLWHGWGPPLASFRLAAAAYARPCRLSGLVTSSTFHAFTCVCPNTLGEACRSRRLRSDSHGRPATTTKRADRVTYRGLPCCSRGEDCSRSGGG